MGKFNLKKPIPFQFLKEKKKKKKKKDPTLQWDNST